MIIQISEIEKFFPDYLHQQSFRINMLKEYFHYQMLNIIYNTKFSDNLYFLGGTCLRIVHNFQRFSENLDFDCFNYSQKNHEELCQEVVAKFRLQGIHDTVEPIRAEKLKRLKAFQKTINFPQLLFDLNISAYKEEKFKIKIEAQSHGFTYKPELKIIQKFDVFTSINKMPDDIILSTKLCAALERQKGRDFLDVINLMEFTKPNFEYLNERIKINNQKYLKEYLLDKTKDINFDAKMNDCRHLVWNEAEFKKIQYLRQYIEQKL